MDNSAIERIAAPDLTEDALALLKTYRADDNVIFFLGRLVWQGKMVKCAPPLLEIAIDPSRGRYARIAAIRGVMSVDDAGLKENLWEAIAGHPGPLDRAVFAELLQGAPTTSVSVTLLLRSLEHVAPDDPSNFTGLGQALHEFVGRLPVMKDEAEDHPLGRLVEGLNLFLEREPFVERGECHVSKEFVWLMPVALHAVDRMVAARSAQSLGPGAIAVLRHMPVLRFWRGTEINEYKTSLTQNVPRWQELNDLLYWTSIEACRARMAVKGESLLDDWRMAFNGHFWGFGPADFERCLGWLKSKSGDDRSVALSRCLRLYVEADRPIAWLTSLRAAVADDESLSSNLEAHLNPKPSPAMEKMEAEERQWRRKSDARDRKEKKNRADWIRALKADPDRVLHPPGLKPGEYGADQHYLLQSAMTAGVSTSREDGANWSALIAEFGEPVARAFRDAAIAHWRAYRPTLWSEGEGNIRSTTPYSLLFAMTGLAIEAGEDRAFAQRLSEDEARLAFRYITWELNGFPSWFEPLYREFPGIGREAVTTELLWELEHSVAEHPTHYILDDILYHAPWLHRDVAPVILDWLRSHDMPNARALDSLLNILTGGSTGPEDLVTLAAEKVKGTTLVEQRPRWFALWTDTQPGVAIPALEAVLEGLSPADASDFAQQFIVGLLGDRRGTGMRVGAYRNARDLKALYVLMHRYIRTAEDIDRANKGVYSPTLRDNAQDARSTLFNMLVEVPGAEAYAAIKALEKEHPEPDHRRWMGIRAQQRATQDADEPLWSTEQVRDFAR
jgi:hypothetical protein